MNIIEDFVISVNAVIITMTGTPNPYRISVLSFWGLWVVFLLKNMKYMTLIRFGSETENTFI